MWKNSERKFLVLIVNEVLEGNQYIDWGIIASSINLKFASRKSAIDCLIQYANVDDPNINNNSWSDEEDSKLVDLVRRNNGRNWLAIADSLGTNRTSFQCYQHYQQFLNPTIVKSGDWSIEEDEKLKEVVESLGYTKWDEIACMVPGRSKAQCMMRWSRSMLRDDALVEGRWSADDEARLLIAASLYDAPLSDSTKKDKESIERMRQQLLSPVTISSSSSSSDADEGAGADAPETAAAALVVGSKVSQNARWAAIAALVPGK